MDECLPPDAAALLVVEIPSFISSSVVPVSLVLMSVPLLQLSGIYLSV